MKKVRGLVGVRDVVYQFLSRAERRVVLTGGNSCDQGSRHGSTV